MPKVNSVYARNQAPRDVKIWEEQIEHAETPEAAELQMTYHLALQVRTVKLLLIWTMVVIPIVAAVFLIVLSNVLEPSDTSF